MSEVDKQVQLKSVVEELNQLLECPVCLEVLKCPLKLCLRGHSLCGGCAKNLQTCPTCQSAFTLEDPVTPIFVKHLIESLPRFCCYRDSGCDEIFHRKQNHEDLCGFRPFRCQQSKCEVTVPLCMLRKHYEEVHTQIFIIKSTVQSLSWSEFQPEKSQSRKTFNPVYLYNNLFWLQVENDVVEKCLRFQWFITPCGKVKDDYYVRIKFEEGDFIYASTLQAKELGSYSFNNHEVNSDDDNNSNGSNALIDRVFKMEVPQSSLKYFIDDDGCLNYKLEFFSTSKPAL